MTDEKSEKQFCANCGKEIPYTPRYPNMICGDCLKLVTDENGRPVEYGVSGFDDDIKGYYTDTNPPTEYPSDTCYINGVPYHASAARFGGVVIQKL